MCTVCRNHFEKPYLVRVVKNKSGQIFVDKTFKAEGRGAYVCKNPECLEKLEKTKALNRAFKCEVPVHIYSEIKGEF
ncbi:MAG: YlxR family protein [Clostridia bacterium]|nr:YlxR family protein [Clostridia bacterium]